MASGMPSMHEHCDPRRGLPTLRAGLPGAPELHEITTPDTSASAAAGHRPIRRSTPLARRIGPGFIHRLDLLLNRTQSCKGRVLLVP